MTAQSAAIAVAMRAASRHASTTIAYTRGAVTATFSAVRGRRLQSLANGDVFVSSEAADWICQADELASLTPAEPEAGDTIVCGAVTYAVAAVEDGRCWRFIDPAQTWIRIHTVRT